MSSPFGVRPPDTVAAAAAAGQRGGLGLAWPAAGAAQAEVEAPRVQGVEQAELLDGGQRGAVPHLHRPGAEPDRRRRGGGQRQHHGRGGAGHARVEMVLGEPVAGVAEPFGLLGQVDAVAQRLGRGRAGRDRDEVQDGQRGGRHAGLPPHLRSRVAATARAGTASSPSGPPPQPHGRVGDLAPQHRGDVGLEQFEAGPVLRVGQAAGVGVQVQDRVAELLVVAVHLLDHLGRAADQGRGALDEVLQRREHRLHAKPLWKAR